MIISTLLFEFILKMLKFCAKKTHVHFMYLKCCKLDIIRQEFYAKMTSIYPDFHSMNNVDKFTFIMNSHDYDINKMCITFISRMYELRQVILKV